MFGEKKAEYSKKQGKDIPVWQSPKYLESREKALEIINGGHYGLKESDFWINMNETKSGKMAYTGLIISHNGCLKINDNLKDKFRPECVTMDKAGYNGSLVYTYCCQDQGLYEVGEVNPRNCTIDYPYAMALKRLQDRVILKLSKLAYAGIYSEAEADEFGRKDEPPKKEQENPEKAKDTEGEPPAPAQNKARYYCAECGKPIGARLNKETGEVKQTAEEFAKLTKTEYGKCLCLRCAGKAEKERTNADNGG